MVHVWLVRVSLVNNNVYYIVHILSTINIMMLCEYAVWGFNRIVLIIYVLYSYLITCPHTKLYYKSFGLVCRPGFVNTLFETNLL